MWQMLIPAAIGAATSIFSASKQAGAAKDAAAASSAATTETNALNRELFYQQRTDNEPWRQTGVNALAKLGGMYGLGGTGGAGGVAVAGGAQGAQSTSPQVTDYGQYSRLNPQMEEHFRTYGESFGGDREKFGQWWHENYDAVDGYDAPTRGQYAPPGSNPRHADFYDSPDYQFRFNEGQRALNARAGVNGMLGSGAAMKAAQAYGQQTASAEYGNYFNRLSGLAGLGQTANSANASASSAYGANTGNALMGNARNLGSSYAAQGDAWAQGINGVADAAGDAYGSWRRSRGR